MEERRSAPRARTLRGGKILFNNKHSIIDCRVRNLSPGGACIEIENPSGIPKTFELLLEGERAARWCDRTWQAEHAIGVAFREGRVQTQGDRRARAEEMGAPRPPHRLPSEIEHAKPEILRSQLLTLRAAFDEIDVGVVLLDQELRAQFINRAFRQMWQFPDEKADSKPAFVALMYHGRDTRAYAIPSGELDAYVAERVAHVKAGDERPRDLRLTSGRVLRFQCTVLPAGGRMLCYTDVTDIVRHADELELLQQGMEHVRHGVLLLDADLNVRFANAVLRKFWGVSHEQIRGRPWFPKLLRETIAKSAYHLSPDQIDAFIEQRVGFVRDGAQSPVDLPLKGGGTIRSQCTVLPGGGRMVTYHDVSDLVRQAKELEGFATTDGLTGVYNRRHFLVAAEDAWLRLQRYQRPLSLIILDVDRFKSINDRFGHEVGDQALAHLAALCNTTKRSADLIARLGGEEFALLLPETSADEAMILAERLRQRVEDTPLHCASGDVSMTVSLGVAEATLSMSGVAAVLRAADSALYQAKETGRNKVARFTPIEATQPRLAAE